MNLLKFLTRNKEEKAEVPAELPETLDEAREKRLAKPTNKLTEEEQLEFVHLISQGLTPTQCVQKFEESTGIKLNITLYYNYIRTKKWKSKITELREQYLNRLDLIDSSHKSVRLRRVEVIMDKALKKGDLKTALSANEQARREFQNDEGTVVYWNNPVYQQFNQLSNEELIKRHKEATEKLRSINGPSRPAEENKVG